MNSTAGQIPLPNTRGCYVLVLWLAKPQQVEVGRLGKLAFQAGYYLYVGSAFGAGGIAGRLNHHLNSKKRHWHIDWLRCMAELQEIWYREDKWGGECLWATELAEQTCLIRPHPGFGASDCRCNSHLFYCPSAGVLSFVRAEMRKSTHIITFANQKQACK